MTTPAPQAVAWRIVPVEPDPAMMEAYHAARDGGRDSLHAIWPLVLAASPVPEGVREKIAEILEPRAFGAAMDIALFAGVRELARAKADAVLSLLSEGR